ncbi:MAG: hypothetical protein M1820_005033 [Bogoriella megaspora]|nr:MAG: hypothetical protein M1820_005033 [Bogoriella megaspora]
MFPCSFYNSRYRTLFVSAGKIRTRSLLDSHGRGIIFSRRFSCDTSSSAQAKATPKALAADIPVEEERNPGYNPKNFYHPNPGEVLDGKYELKVKLGYGSSSTVWLAQDIRRRWGAKPYVAIKIDTCDFHDQAAAGHEAEISNHIKSAKPDDPGLLFVRTVDESFEISGPNGSHLCLVFEPMREPIWLLRRRLGLDSVTKESLPLFKLYIIVLLGGLDYLHTKCKIIHTDLSLNNILVTFEDTSVIDAFVQAQAREPMPRKVLDDRTVYLSHNNFGNLKLIGDELPFKDIFPKITDFGLAQRGDEQEPLIFPIQAHHCRAPEVMLGTGWSYSADVWNFGVMIWELLAGEDLFQKLDGGEGTYSALHHLAGMVALVGPIPAALVQRERDMRHWRWAPEILNDKGELRNNAADFFGGPFFDDHGESFRSPIRLWQTLYAHVGQFVGRNVIPRGRNLKDTLPRCIDDEEADLFLSFMRRTLCWLPEERATAEELQKHPWLGRHWHVCA